MSFKKLLSLITSLMLVGLLAVACGRWRTLRRLAVPTSTPTLPAAVPLTVPTSTPTLPAAVPLTVPTSTPTPPAVVPLAVPTSTLPSLAVAPTSAPSIVEPAPADKFPADHWTYQDLPNITDAERKAYCKKTNEQWERYYQDRMDEAQQLSDRLEEYIRSWYYGDADATLPKGLLPPSIDNEKTRDWTLLRPEDVRPEDQWYIIPAREEPAVDNFRTLYQNAAETHVTYLKLLFVAPFDSELLVEGDFPHARFMDYQILEPYDPRFPVTGNMGQMEIPIVDVDIEPDPGHTNPFRVGADRNATQRHYHLTFDLKTGNAVALNPEVMKSPGYRAPGNERVGGPFGSSGPYGNGAIIPSVLWLRYYAPDRGLEPLGGVSLPKALFKLSTGETFWLRSDFSLAAERQTTTVAGAEESPREPFEFMGPVLGWLKVFDLWLIRAELQGYYRSRPWGVLPQKWVKRDIRSTHACYFSRGPQMPPPGNCPHSATDCPYNNYLLRPVQLGPHKVYAITGRLPTTPRTCSGEPTMEKAQARYWSICHHGSGPGKKYNSVVYGCLIDEDIAVNEQNEYIIIYTRGEDRPSNARPECGVTWQDFGNETLQAFLIRWMSVTPDHYMEEYAPNEKNAPWETVAWSQDTYDQSLIGENHPGVMGPYHPVIHYLTKAEFEALGCPIDPAAIPEWE